ncbi:multidrug resistance-associated [Seiridium cupressi]
MLIASATLASIAVAAAGVLSYFEDQRSIRPSDLLVLYFSASDVLLLPTLRSFWLVPCSTTLRSLAIVTLLMTTVVVFVESARKLGLLRPVEKTESKEQLVDLWIRCFFTWALPFLRKGYSSVLILGQIPQVDHELREDSTWTKLHDYWHSVRRGRYRLLRATFWSHSRLLFSAVLPRLALSAFVFCQPFLIDASVSYLTAGAQDNVDEQFGLALIGAFVLVYLGIAERIAQALRLIHELWASILEVGIALWLLQRQMSWAFLVSLIITLSMLSNMKAVQKLGMTSFLRNAITKLRELELRTSEKFRMLLIWQILLGNAPVTLAPFITFAVYIIIAVVSKSETLLSAQAFASLSLISLATAPLIRFCQALPSLAQAAACFGRIETFCLKESTFEETNLSISPAGSSNDTLVLREMRYRQPEKGGPLMIFEHAHIAWDSNSSPVLQDLTLELPSGLTAIFGPVASGKSTLLWTILGETKLKAGAMTSAVTRAAFCSQTPWIMDDTIRHSITLGTEFDQEWYNFSIDYSCLQGDLDALPRRDFTAAGSNGVSLSGGQQQRLTLARAIYSRLPIVLLDDVMSGLDAKIANILSARLFRNDGYFRRAGISVILATNDQKILRYMDNVLVPEGGKLIHSGAFHELGHWSAGLSERNSSSETITEVAGSHSSDNDTSTHSQAPHQATDSPAEDSMGLDERQNGNWSSSNTSISAGDLGVALVIILQFNNLLSQSIQPWTKLETSIGAVSRVQKFVEETPQEPVGNHNPLPDWPALGSIRLGNVTASYATGGHPVLTDLSLEINPGEKVAICGPSGSGKSTILMALLRMIEVQGRITIDDIDTSRLSGDDFHSRLIVLPQEPFFLPGTVRSNLDVRGPSSSDVMQKALEGVGLWGRVCSIGGLDADLDPTEWSQGEKQLLCLARAWLTPSKVLIVDEATSSVDNKTESIMLDVIENTFKEHTVISVVHRFAKIEQYDRVAVLKQGKVIEYDTPHVLLDRESPFRELYTAYMSEH